MSAASADHLPKAALGSFSWWLKTAIDSQMDKVELMRYADWA